MLEKPVLFGILNITEDSFSDGGLYLDSQKAFAQALKLESGGADVIDIGAVSSNPNATRIKPEIEIARMEWVLDELAERNIPISIDTYHPVTQKWALKKGIQYLNDISGFRDPSLHADLAASKAKLVLMHSLQSNGIADTRDSEPELVLEGIFRFFDRRLAELQKAGISKERIILDPGMGFFLGSNEDSSIRVLHELPKLKEHYQLPFMISVSRKSFIRKISGMDANKVAAPNTLAELIAVIQGADYIRTHDPLNFGAVWKIFEHFPHLHPEKVQRCCA